jgi:tetratricopeptide (TPR) repeat protein
MPDLLEQVRASLADRYAVERELGHGGMAVVFLAQDLKHGRPVALKVLRPEVAAALGAERFVREIEIAARLAHPHILSLHDSGEAGGFLYYVMPYVAGASLRDRLNREKQLPVDAALHITTQVADALSYAHSRGVVHRDIKPENVLLLGDDVLVADFGIARAITVAGGEQLTSTGIAVGTPAYMSPEQGAGESHLDGRSDVYSLGCVLYEMLAGTTPFVGPTAQAIQARRMTDPVPPLRTVRETLPPQVEQVIMAALAKVPADRFATVSRFSDALRESALVAQSQPDAPGRRWVRLGLGVALILVAAVAFWRIGPHVRASPSSPSPNRMAVFPFTVEAAPGREHLGEAVMDLLSSAMDGAGELRRVDPVSVIGSVQRAKVAVVDPPTGARLATALGAGRYIVGAVVQVGDQLRVSASVYDAARPTEPMGDDTQQGPEEELAHLVERLATDLVGHLSLGPSARLENVAAARAASYPALKAYLEGEHYLRRGIEDSASSFLLRAVTLDSTFALAWYRLSLAQDFTYDYHMAESADRAYRLRDRLSPRDQLLAAVSRALAHDDAARAESLALAAVGKYPDEVEAWWQLGVLRLWDHWRWGRSPLEGLEPFERALALDPGHRNTLWNATWLRLYEGSYAKADSLIQQALARGVQPGPVRQPRAWPLTARVIKVFTEGSPVEQEALLAEFANQDDHTLFVGGQVAMFSDALSGAEAVLRLLDDSTKRSPETRARACVRIGAVALAGGRWDAAQTEFVRAAAAGEPGLATQHRAYFAAAPFFDLPRAMLLALRDSLSQWPVATRWDARPDDPERWGWYQPPELRDHIRSYLRGLLSARAGDTVDAELQAGRLEHAHEPGDSAALLPDLALEIRALAAAQQGRDSVALAILQRMTMRTVWHYQEFASPTHLRPLARFLRGEMLFRLGRYDEALGWYWFGVLSRPEVVFQAPSFLRRGEIYEKLGDPVQAVREYRRFVTRWRGADERYQPLVRDVEARIARLALGRRD